MIATAIDAYNSMDFSEDAAGGLIASIYTGDYMDCADILISDDVMDGLIATSIDAGNPTGCDDDAG